LAQKAARATSMIKRGQVSFSRMEKVVFGGQQQKLLLSKSPVPMHGASI
jgi:hypothetical protein